jgi:hypothetical protein
LRDQIRVVEDRLNGVQRVVGMSAALGLSSTRTRRYARPRPQRVRAREPPNQADQARPADRRQLRSVSGAAADMVLTPQTRHRPGLVRVTVILIERCRSVLTERCRKIAR